VAEEVEEAGEAGEAGGPHDSVKHRADLASRTMLTMETSFHQAIKRRVSPQQQQFHLVYPFLTQQEINSLEKMTIPWEAMTSFSSQYQASLARLWPIATLGGQRRTQVFTDMATELDWSARTRSTYWVTILSAMKIMGIAQNAHDHNMSRRAKAEAAAAPPWDLWDQQQFITPQMIKVFTETVNNLHPRDPMIAGFVALMLGQRVSDILKLQTANVLILVQTRTLAVRFAETKTSATTGQFTLALGVDSQTARLLIRARVVSMRTSKPFLFMDSNTQLDINKGEAEIHQSLFRIWGIKIDLRALRRTGLSRIASAGAKLETVLAISRHRSVAMLERYLANGIFHGQLMIEMQNAFSSAWEHTLPTII
jgi:hypothetical protein